MTEADQLDAVADQLCEVTLALEDVDLNALLVEDARTVLDTREELGELCLRYRQDAAASRRAERQRPREEGDR